MEEVKYKGFMKINPDSPVDIIKSLCVECKETGDTRLLTTRIPFFKDVILSSFSCEHCGYSNNDVTFGGAISEQGALIDVNVYSKDCLNRFVVKSEYATITIPEIQLTIPKHTQKGSIKTIEGYISATIDGLKMHQEQRRLSDLETAIKLDEYIERLQRMCEGSQMPFHFIIDDPSGNSYVQNPHAPARDVYVSTKHYLRTQKDLADIGFADEEEIKQSELKYKSEEQERKPDYLEHKFVKECQFTAEEVDNMILLASKWTEVKKEHEEVKEVFSAGFDYTKSIDQQSHDIGNINNEAFVIPLECYQCGEIGVQKTCVSNIPHFKEIIIMAFNCDSCEFRSVEVKQGGGISEKGRKVTLSVKNIEDLKRDLYKGDDCSVEIPEVDLKLAPGSLGGIYKSFIC